MMEKPARGKALRLIRIERTVSSLTAIVPFYTDALGFTLVDITPFSSTYRYMMDHRDGQIARLKLGEQEVYLTQFAEAGRSYPDHAASNDLYFQHMAIVVDDIDAAYRKLSSHKAFRITEGGPVQLPPSTGNVKAFKFRDPDGHPLELIQFEKGFWTTISRDPRTNAPTIGIDHSAIVVSDRSLSLSFYCDQLGLMVSAEGWNSGPGQSQLDHRNDDKVQVIALCIGSSKVPHLELLAYPAPFGQSVMEPIWPCDIAGDRLVMDIDDLGALLQCMTGASNVEVLSRSPAFALVRDPDGHLIILKDQAAGLAF